MINVCLLMCDGHVFSLKHHTLVDLNVKRIITSGHEFVIQHILIRYQVCWTKSINYVLLLLTVKTTY